MNMMTSLGVAVVLALCGGLAVAIQGSLSSMVGQSVGPLGSSLILHLSGAVIAGLLVLVTGAQTLSGWTQVPWYAWIGTGATGVLVIIAFSLSVPRIGMTATAALIIASQMLAAMVFDHFAWIGLAQRSISPLRAVGVGLLFLGAWLVLQY